VPRASSIHYTGSSFSVGLGWADLGEADDVRVIPQIPFAHLLMQGEPVALQVPGAGWLKYGFEYFGADLAISDTPAYEWRVINGSPGHTFFGDEAALWNSTAQDYLVNGGETWGINLNWYQHTLPTSGGGGTTAPPPTGSKTITFYNCFADGHVIEMWTRDVTAGGPWVHQTSLGQPPEFSGCIGSEPSWSFTFTPNHTFQVFGVDVQLNACGVDDPNVGPCVRFGQPLVFHGNANGYVGPFPMGVQFNPPSL